jgi:hypothetical protein
MPTSLVDISILLLYDIWFDVGNMEWLVLMGRFPCYELLPCYGTIVSINPNVLLFI